MRLGRDARIGTAPPSEVEVTVEPCGAQAKPGSSVAGWPVNPSRGPVQCSMLMRFGHLCRPLLQFGSDPGVLGFARFQLRLHVAALAPGQQEAAEG